MRGMPVVALLVALAASSAACQVGDRASDRSIDPSNHAGAAEGEADRRGLDPGQPLLTLERGPCFGRCPEYTVMLYGDGRVEYMGVRAVSLVGAASGRADSAAVWAAYDTLLSNGVMTADAEYGIDNPACGSYIPDTPWIALSVLATLADGGVKRVTFEQGCAGTPAYLLHMSEQLDRIAAVDGWVRGPSPEVIP